MAISEEVKCEQQCADDSVLHADCTEHDEGLQHDCDQCHRTEAHEDSNLFCSLEKTENTLVERTTSIIEEELVPDGGWGWVIVFGASLILVSVDQISELFKSYKMKIVYIRVYHINTSLLSYFSALGPNLQMQNPQKVN